MDVNIVFCSNNLLPAGVRLAAFGGLSPVGLGGPDTKTAKGFIINW